LNAFKPLYVGIRFAIIALVPLFVACSKDLPVDPGPDGTPLLSGLAVPSLLFNQSQTEFVISVLVESPSDPDAIGEVRYQITKTGSGNVVTEGRMLDDGTQGDLIPGDNRFTAQITGQFAQSDTGTFIISSFITTTQGQKSEPISAHVTIEAGSNGASPLITRATGPASVLADAAFDFVVTVEVTDPDGPEDIAKVRYVYAPPGLPNPTRDGELRDDGQEGDQTPGDGVYSVRYNNGDFSATADYQLRFQAEDRSGNFSNPQVVMIRGRMERTQEPLLANLVAPALIILEQVSTTGITLRLDVDDPQGIGDIDALHLLVTLPGGEQDPGNPFAMQHDGGNTFIASYELPILVGEFRFVFQARDKSNFLSNRIEHALAVTQIATPIITNAMLQAQVVIADMQDSTIVTSVQISDPQGLTDVAWVRYSVFQPDGQEVPDGPFAMVDDGDIAGSGDQTAGDGTYSGRFTFDAATALAGDYKFSYQAKDNSDSLSNVLEKTIAVFFNNSPELSNLVAPDTVAINPERTTQILITVDVADAEGLEDIEFVKFRSFLPDGNEARESPFELKDDGDRLVTGDQEAGDGTYSIVINLPSQGVQPGDFTFIFKAEDKGGLSSDEIIHIMTVTDETGGTE
jgi:hypothetical protein